MENPDSNESFKYIKLSMRIAGMRLTKRFRNFYRLYGVIYHINALILFPMAFVVNLFFVENSTELFKNIAWCLTMVSESIKFMVLFPGFQKFHKNAKVILAKIDKSLISADEKELIRWVINFNQKIHLTYCFGFGMFTLLLAFSLITKNHLMFPTWFPFNWKTSTDFFFIALGYQTISIIMEMMADVSTNMIPIINIIVLTAHTRALAMRVQLIGNNVDKTPEENYTELKNCIEDQGYLNKYFLQITQIISGSIFIQFVMTAFTMAIAIVYFLYVNESLIEKITAIGYLCAIALEILPCCYFSDEYTNAADFLTTAIFTCNWKDQDRKFKKAIIILMQNSQKSNVIYAGKLIPVSLHSFFMLLKFSFSLFTLVSHLDS